LIVPGGAVYLTFPRNQAKLITKVDFRGKSKENSNFSVIRSAKTVAQIAFQIDSRAFLVNWSALGIN
jgi:hypothetical protein